VEYTYNFFSKCYSHIPVVALRVLQKHPNVANIEALRLRYLQETGRTRPNHLNRETPDGLDYISWVENLATQMLILLDHIENEERGSKTNN
jgi:hypothetical protein